MKTTDSLYIKNMVCQRCVATVKQILDKIEIPYETITLGEATLKGDFPDQQQLAKLDQLLIENGFERIDDKKSRLLEQIQTTVIETIHHSKEHSIDLNWSQYLSEKLKQDYHYLSNLFSSVNGITLEQYIIKQKIEKVKEYLFYGELSVKEIAYELGYSSVAHLSSQFKKVTGLTPTQFKEMGVDRKPLDKIL